MSIVFFFFLQEGLAASCAEGFEGVGLAHHRFLPLYRQISWISHKKESRTLVLLSLSNSRCRLTGCWCPC